MSWVRTQPQRTGDRAKCRAPCCCSVDSGNGGPYSASGVPGEGPRHIRPPPDAIPGIRHAAPRHADSLRAFCGISDEICTAVMHPRSLVAILAGRSGCGQSRTLGFRARLARARELNGRSESPSYGRFTGVFASHAILCPPAILPRFHPASPLISPRCVLLSHPLRSVETRHAKGRISPVRIHRQGAFLYAVAVIGTGIAGNAAAWALSKRYGVTVYDRDTRPGGSQPQP